MVVDIFTGVYGTEESIWLESAESLAHAKQRVNEIAAQKPGSYFVFDPSEGRLLYQIHASSLVDQCHSEMQAARSEWERAGEELEQALALAWDLNATSAFPDGNLALRNARLRESLALKKYRRCEGVYRGSTGESVERSGDTNFFLFGGSIIRSMGRPTGDLLDGGRSRYLKAAGALRCDLMTGLTDD
jgi:hypothetical protein